MNFSSSSLRDMAKRVGNGDRRAVSQAITLIESAHPRHNEQAMEFLSLLQTRDSARGSSRHSLRVGLSGVPGAGKSTLIETLGLKFIAQGHKLAVLAIDPSSVTGGGAILADKTRMPRLAIEEHAYIRPSPSGYDLGGVARRTREAIFVCEAAGFNRIIIETVGVGQAEVGVASMCDLFLLLLLPKSGDEFQALKRGIIQLADIIIVNKADGDSIKEAQRTVAEYSSALRLLSPRIEGRQVPVLSGSALEDKGIDNLLGEIDKGFAHLTGTLTETNMSLWEHYRRRQNINGMWEELKRLMTDHILHSDKLQKIVTETENAVINQSMLPTRAATEIFRKLKLN